jgi:chromatin segregation and condensation protein Rec8/ScpA/Scc1 (kleisin family)
MISHGKEASNNFFLEPPYLYLLNPDMLKPQNILQFPLMHLSTEFYEKMKELPELDYKIMGLFIKSTARIHNMRVSRAISIEKELEREYELKKKKDEFIIDKPLRQYLKRPEAHFTSEPASDAFYEQLMVSLRTEGIKKERKRRKIEYLEVAEEEVKQKTERRRRKRITIEKSAVFDAVVIDFDRVEVDILINEVLSVIRQFSKNNEREIQFDDIIQYRIVGSVDVEKWRLEQVRILISLLYLIKEGFVEAFQDLDTKEITVIITEKGRTETFGLKPIEKE